MNSATITDRHVAIRYDAMGNSPTATLDFDGELSGDGRSMTGTLTWQRVDQPTAPNLQWKVTAELTMAARP